MDRPSNPSGNLVELRGDELEDLIEVDGPAEPYAETQAIQMPTDPSCPSMPADSSGHRTGPGEAHRRTPERTERVRSGGDSARSVPAVHKARTASLRRSGTRRKARTTSRPEDSIDEMLGACLGSYRILSLIGEGGMGRVYLAEHIKLGRKVALKLLRPEYAVKRDAVARFFQEAQAVNQIRHDNIVDITDFVELDTGETYIIMELLQGEDLADIQRKSDQPMPLHRAMQISLQVCEALEAAHRAGIIHRDLKPDNIFIVNDGAKRDYIKLLDFGVAKLLGGDSNPDGWKTAAGSVIGTPAYMSPEQAAGIPVDHRSDIYSLGAILYELFTGHPVFRAKSFGEFVVKHMNQDPIPPRELADAPRIPIALEEVILRCLAKDPNKRYQSVSDLRMDLAKATATVETVVRAVPLPPDKARKKGRRWLLFLGVAGGVAALAGAAFWIAAGLSIEDEAPLPGEVQPGAIGELDRKAPPLPGPTPGTTPLGGPSEQVVTAKLTLRSRPTGADVYRKDDPSASLGKTPLELRLPNIGERMEFVFRLPGHRDGAATVEVVDNTVIGVDLEELPDQPPTVARPAPHRPSGRRVRKAKPKRPASDNGAKPAAPPPPKKINPEDTVDPFSP